MRTTPARALVASTALVVMLAAGCGSGDDGGVGGARIVATTGIWADVVANLACDATATVDSLVPDGTDPHAYEPSLADRELLEEADLVVVNGLGLEEGLEDTVEAATSDTDSIVVTMADLTGSIAGDPHVWFDPSRVATALPDLADALIGAGADADDVSACLVSYSQEVLAADAEIESMLESIPQSRRKLVTNHDSLAYFAARYGFEVVGTVMPSSSTLAAANPADLADLAELIEELGVAAVFVDATEATDDADAVASRVGAAVVALHTGALAEPGSGADTYLGLLRTDAELIAEALG